MAKREFTVLIMAAGTGGHVFPALSIARSLQKLSARVEWLGTPSGMENALLEDTGIKLHRISVKGLRGTGIKRKLMAPVMLLQAFAQSLSVIRSVKPDCVLGMGGFVCGPAGLAAKLLGKPLLLHEQNAVAGLTNRLLSRLANRVFEAFPGTFNQNSKVIHTGNPLREDIIALNKQEPKDYQSDRPLNVLVLGGSQGALAINQCVPEMLANWNDSPRPQILHQAGKGTLAQTRDLYQSLGLELNDTCQVEPFIKDMASAYTWADIVICRSGASTVSELAAAAMPAILVPYPHHKDQQQLLNARWLEAGDAVLIIEQSQLSARALLDVMLDLNAHRSKLHEMSANARAVALCNASEVIANQCLEYAHA